MNDTKPPIEDFFPDWDVNGIIKTPVGDADILETQVRVNTIDDAISHLTGKNGVSNERLGVVLERALSENSPTTGTVHHGDLLELLEVEDAALRQMFGDGGLKRILVERYRLDRAKRGVQLDFDEDES